MKEDVNASPIYGLKERSNKHSCILLVMRVFPSSLFYKSFKTMFLSMIVFFRTSVALGLFSTF
jgi:hypothetical protein